MVDSEAEGDAGWELLDQLLPCEIEYAAHPHFVPPPRWAPCPDGTPGCLELVVDWATTGGRPTVGMRGRSTSAGTNLLVSESGLPGDRHRVLITRLDGEVFAALQSRSTPPNGSCRVVIAAIGAETASVMVIHGVDDEIVELFFVAGPFANDVAWRSLAARLQPNEYGPIIWDSPALIGRSVVLSTPGLIVRSDPESRAFGVVTRAAQFGSYLCCASALRSNVMFLGGPAPDGVWVLPDAGPAARIHQFAANGAHTEPIHSDGQLYWAEGHDLQTDGTFRSVDLWTAAAVSPPLTLTPRRIAGTRVNLLPRLRAAGGGRLSYDPGTQGNGIVVVNVADGTSWTITSRDSRLLYVAVPFMTLEEIGITVNVLGGATNATVRRIRYDAMGAADPSIP